MDEFHAIDDALLLTEAHDPWASHSSELRSSFSPSISDWWTGLAGARASSPQPLRRQPQVGGAAAHARPACPDCKGRPDRKSVV
jgi:hypothetical protein